MKEDSVKLINSGMDFQIIPYEDENLESEGYTKLPRDVFERVSMSLQGVPGQLVAKVTEDAATRSMEQLTKNAYKLVLKDGMHLGKSGSLNGAYKGLAYYDSTNKLATHADWVPLSIEGSPVGVSPQVVLGIFNAMSIVTGQYFLSQINSKLGDIKTGIADIKEYLEVEKRSEIIACDMILMNVYKNLGFIMENELERQSTSVELKRIKGESLKNSIFLKTKIESTKRRLKLTEKSNADDLNKAFTDLERDIPQYWCAVRSYINATVLDAVITEMDSPQYLHGIKRDLEGMVRQYDSTYKSVNEKIDLFIKKANDLNKKKKLPKAFKNAIDWIPAYDLLGVGIKLAGLGIIEIDKKLADSAKQKKQMAIRRQRKFNKACRNLRPLSEPVQLIDAYRISRNSQMELLCTNGEAYVKYLDE